MRFGDDGLRTPPEKLLAAPATFPNKRLVAANIATIHTKRRLESLLVFCGFLDVWFIL